jgi:hypothetical protein
VFLRGFTPAMTAALEDRWFIRSAPADPLASDAA